MTKPTPNPKVDAYIARAERWHTELDKLRTLLLATGLTEELKWGVPCYSLDGRNVVLMHVFKDYCALLFVKGALLPDPHGILVQQTKNVQAARQVRFTTLQDVTRLTPAVKTLLRLAIDAEQARLQVPMKKTEEFDMPEEFQLALDEMPALKKAFGSLTPGRQRAYLLYFSAPKQSKTREARVVKSIPQIMAGKGLND